jgi:site-specific recombinase XerC
MLGLGTPVSIRNRALLLLAFATGLRRSNLTALCLEDLAFCEEGLRILVKREKQNREGVAGRKVGVPLGENPVTCAVRALEEWIKIRGPEPGPLFTRLDTASGPQIRSAPRLSRTS